jgi:hypothetical protein
VGTGRGALLGPEESGPAHRDCCSLGVWDCFFWVTATLSSFLGLVWWVAGAGSHQTVGVGVCSGCVVPGVNVHLIGGGFGLVTARILRTV